MGTTRRTHFLYSLAEIGYNNIGEEGCFLNGNDYLERYSFGRYTVWDGVRNLLCLLIGFHLIAYKNFIIHPKKIFFFSSKTSTIVLTQKLATELDSNELRYVITHELTHIKNGDTKFSTLAYHIKESMAGLKVSRLENAGTYQDGVKYETMWGLITTPLIHMICKLLKNRDYQT